MVASVRRYGKRRNILVSTLLCCVVKSRLEIFRTPQELRYRSHYIISLCSCQAFLRGVGKIFGRPHPRPLSCEERGVSHRTPPSFAGKEMFNLSPGPSPTRRGEPRIERPLTSKIKGDRFPRCARLAEVKPSLCF